MAAAQGRRRRVTAAEIDRFRRRRDRAQCRAQRRRRARSRPPTCIGRAGAPWRRRAGRRHVLRAAAGRAADGLAAAAWPPTACRSCSAIPAATICRRKGLTELARYTVPTAARSRGPRRRARAWCGVWADKVSTMSDEANIEVREIAAAGYRTLRSLRFPVRRLSVFVGANGVGKTNLYRALQTDPGRGGWEFVARAGRRGRHGIGALGGQAPSEEAGTDPLDGRLGKEAAAVETSGARTATATRCRPALSIPTPSTSGFACRRRRRSRSSRK